MAVRILTGCILLWVVCTAPWWWAAALIGIAIFIFDGYPEACVLFSVFIIRAYPHMLFSERALWFAGLFIVWALLAFIANQVHGSRHNDLYA